MKKLDIYGCSQAGTINLKHDAPLYLDTAHINCLRNSIKQYRIIQHKTQSQDMDYIPIKPRPLTKSYLWVNGEEDEDNKVIMIEQTRSKNMHPAFNIMSTQNLNKWAVKSQNINQLQQVRVDFISLDPKGEQFKAIPINQEQYDSDDKLNELYDENGEVKVKNEQKKSALFYILNKQNNNQDEYNENSMQSQQKEEENSVCTEDVESEEVIEDQGEIELKSEEILEENSENSIKQENQSIQEKSEEEIQLKQEDFEKEENEEEEEVVEEEVVVEEEEQQNQQTISENLDQQQQQEENNEEEKDKNKSKFLQNQQDNQAEEDEIMIESDEEFSLKKSSEKKKQITKQKQSIRNEKISQKRKYTKQKEQEVRQTRQRTNIKRRHDEIQDFKQEDLYQGDKKAKKNLIS